MSSIVRGQVANVHDSSESNSSNSTKNKRKRKQVNQEDKAATHRLAYFNLFHHADRILQVSQNHIPLDIPPNADAPALDRIFSLPDNMLPRQAHPRIAAENSGSSDASAANYFSGDSDLTAEPVMGCAADDEGAKSSNSGSTTPVKLPHATSMCADQAPTLAAGSCQQLHSTSLSPQIAENKHCDKKESAQSPTILATTISTSRKWSHDTGFLDSKALPTSQMVQTNHIRTRTITGGCQGLQQKECADSGRGSESWLELRLGFTTELQQKPRHDLGAEGDQRASRESSDNGIDLSPVTLQLLPDATKMAATCAGAAEEIRPTNIISVSHLQECDLPPVYNPAAASFSHVKPKFDDTISRIMLPDHHQFLQNQRKDPAATALQPLDHQQYLVNHHTDPATTLHRSNHCSALRGIYDAGMVYDQAHGYYADQYCNDDRRRWLAGETPDLLMVGAPPMNTAPRTAEVYRPTANLGWPNSTNAEGGSWSANSNPPSVQLQRSVSWQGLLRSMTADPLVHPLPEVRSICSFDTGLDLSGGLRGQHRHMFSAACAGRPPSSQMRSSAAIHQRQLRLAPSKRNVGVWFSLQEAQRFPNENGEDNDLEPCNNIQKVYLRIRDGKMQVSVLKTYLIKKLESSGASHHYYTNADEVEITCRGKILAPNLTIQHVQDTIWLSKDVELNEALGFRYTSSYSQDPHKRVMALCYQRQQVQSVTLNLLKA